MKRVLIIHPYRRHNGGGVWFACLADGSELRVGRTYLARVKEMAGR